MIYDTNMLKKKNPLIRPFYECQEFIQKSFSLGEKLDWDYISRTFDLPDWYLQLHIKDLNWTSLSKYQNFNSDTVRQFQDYIDWTQLSPNDFDIDFVREFKNKFWFKFFHLRKEQIKREFGNCDF